MKKSKILDFLFGYELSEKNFEESAAHHVGKTFSDKLLGGVSSSFAKKILKNPIVGFFDRLNTLFSRIYVKSYSTALLSFGLLTTALCVLSYIFTEGAPLPWAGLLTGGISVIVSIPGLFIDKPLAAAVASSRLLSNLLFDFLCLKRVRGSEDSERVLPTYLCIFIGIIPALPGLFIPPYLPLIIIALAVYLGLALSSPEFSFMLTLLLLPIIPALPHSGTVLLCLVLISLVSFLTKVGLGKRILHFEQYDALIILAGAFILVSGIFNKGFESFENALLLIALLGGYVLAGNLIVNKRLADNAVNIIIISSIPAGVLGIASYFLKPLNLSWIDKSFVGVINGRATSTFGNPNVFSVFLIVAIIFSLTYALDRSRRGLRVLYSLASIINLASLLLTFTRGAWIAIILAAAAYFVLHFKKVPKLLLIPLALSPLTLFAFSPLVSRLLSIFDLSDSSITARLSIWRSAIEMLKDNLFVGVGIGSASFNEEFAKYAESGAEWAPHSHNLFLELACEGGIFLALIFVFLLLVRLRHIASYKPYIKGSSLTSPITMTGLAIFSLVSFGCTDYIFYDCSMFFLFWVVFGIGSATLRISKREFEESLNYQGSESSAFCAVADIRISRE